MLQQSSITSSNTINTTNLIGVVVGVVLGVCCLTAILIVTVYYLNLKKKAVELKKKTVELKILEKRSSSQTDYTSVNSQHCNF